MKKDADSIEMPFVVDGRAGLSHHVLDSGPDPTLRGCFLGGMGGAMYVTYGDAAYSQITL